MIKNRKLPEAVVSFDLYPRLDLVRKLPVFVNQSIRR